VTTQKYFKQESQKSAHESHWERNAPQEMIFQDLTPHPSSGISEKTFDKNSGEEG
jgi:hypothetical protein